MINVFSRNRPLALLASVIVAQILLLAFQVKRDRDVRLIRVWAVAIMSPVERSGTWGFSSIGGVWHGYIDLRNARKENQQLRDELGRLQLRNRELESQADEAQRLKVLLNFRDTHTEAQMLAAQVIGASADPTSHTLFINRGSRDRLRNNMAVVTPDGIVGKLVEVFPNTAQVLLINDKESGVGALFAESRTHGVLKGSGDPMPLMDYVVNDEKFKPGDSILTSGDDRIFPKGLLIGKVTDTKQALPFQIIHVQPAARLDRLEDVLILLSQQQLEPKGSADKLIPPPQPEPFTPLASAAASSKSSVSAAGPTSASLPKPAASSAVKPAAPTSAPRKPAEKPQAARPGAPR